MCFEQSFSTEKNKAWKFELIEKKKKKDNTVESRTSNGRKSSSKNRIVREIGVNFNVVRLERRTYREV